MPVHGQEAAGVGRKSLDAGPVELGQGDDPIHGERVFAGAQLDQPGPRNVGVHAGEDAMRARASRAASARDVSDPNSASGACSGVTSVSSGSWPMA